LIFSLIGPRNFNLTMAPIQRLKRSTAPSEVHSHISTSASAAQPSTWSVLTTVGGAIWATYMVFESAGRIWNWIQIKLEEKRRKDLAKDLAKAQAQDKDLVQKNQLTKRHLQKRFSAPFSSAVNVIHWVTVVVSWIYRHLDGIPHRIQDTVNRAFIKEQDKEWAEKVKDAKGRVKTILGREFPEHYKKYFLDPYDEGSELYDENLEFLKRMQESKKSEESDTIEVHAKW
jgi:hypothetical protein